MSSRSLFFISSPPTLGCFEMKNKDIFMEGFAFGYKLYMYLLEKYKKQEFMYKINSLEDQPHTFCIHIGEAILAVSHVNRLKFKLMFDDTFDSLMAVEDCHIYVAECCQQIYKDGYFDQFLLVCGFLMDFTMYMSYRVTPQFSHTFPQLFAFLYDSILVEKFTARGGWDELKRNSKPWWKAYRYSKRQMEFHSPEKELFNPLYNSETLSEFQNNLEAYEKHEYVAPPVLKTEAQEDTSDYPRSCRLICVASSVLRDVIKVVTKNSMALMVQGGCTTAVDTTKTSATTKTCEISRKNRKKKADRHKIKK